MLSHHGKGSKIIIILLALLTIVVSFQSYYLPRKGVDHNRVLYSQYNNYEIFQDAYFHLIEYKDLYKEYPLENYDLYKYSPTFALFMGLFAFMPDLLGLILWNLLNTLVLIYALLSLKLKPDKTYLLLFLFIAVELITSVQNSQSNALLAGLLILSYSQMDRGKIFPAALLIASTFYIKIFGILGFALFIFYPNKGKSAFYSILSMLILFALPLPFTGFSGLMEQYEKWLYLLQNDHSASVGFSMMGWLQSWFGLDQLKSILLIPGTLLLLLPLIRYKQYGYSKFRLSYLANILIWMVIFNHKAESPTFIIAVTGVAIWYFSLERSPLRTSMLILTLIFTSLSVTDLFPREFRVDVVEEYAIKAVPCIFVWFMISYEMLFTDQYALNEKRSA